MIPLVLLLAAGCAKQTGLTGGERDTTPPMVLEYSPERFSTHFDQKSFSMTFDEFFGVDNLNRKLVISPPLKVPPTYRIRGKTLTLSWTDTLLANTTYQFNFGGAVADITERNPNDDLVYVFSTGSFIDSMAVGGSVVLAQDGSPVEKAAVMLYRGEADSLPATSKPDYFAMTGPDGRFEINYLPEGDFKMFVLKEENPNYIYDGPPEVIGFPGKRIASVQADSTMEQHRLFAFVEADSVQYIVSTAQTDYGYYEVVFNLPAVAPTIQFQIPDTDVRLEARTVLSAGRDTLRSWLNLNDTAWAKVEELRVILNENTTVSDTSFWYVETDPRFRDKAKMEMRANNSGNKLDLDRELTLKFAHPITEMDTSLIHFYCDSVALPTPVPVPSYGGRVHTFPGEYDAECSYSLTLDAGAFRDLFGTYNDSTTLYFSLRAPEDYGILIVSIDDSMIGADMHPIVQLISGSGTVLQTHPVVSGQAIAYGRLTPGTYRLKMVFDANQNGEWDTGNYRTKTQPEKIVNYPDPVEVRSNWDIEVEWAPVPPGE